ncbi:hypothetical protein EON81_00580 [bacterium]|nr:MAG: hypothetical protein EON81_00580 [bacterium]
MSERKCCPDGSCGLPRRDFLRLTALATIAGPVMSVARLVPLEKGEARSLLEKGERTFYRGEDLKFIGMPVGGLCAGQVYLGGDGRLWLWDIFNQIKLGTVAKDIPYDGGSINALGGANYVQPPTQVHPFDQGFAIRVDGKVRKMDSTGWRDVAFAGEYPMGVVEYRDPDSPVAVTLESFSPFSPLETDDSSLPAVVMRYRIRNAGQKSATVEVAGWMENAIGLHTVRPGEAVRVNGDRKARGNVQAVFSLKGPEREKIDPRPKIEIENWTKPTFEGWTVTGTAFGTGPDKGAARSFRMEEGDSNVAVDARVGKLVSREFKIERRFVEFEIAGGNHPKTARLDLLIDGKVVHSATGLQSEAMRLDKFDVAAFENKSAHLEIVDDEKGFWGQITVGRIALVDVPSDTLKERTDFGDMALALIDVPSRTHHSYIADKVENVFEPNDSTGVASGSEFPIPYKYPSAVLGRLTIQPGEEKTATFVVAWRFPNLTLSRIGKAGNHYATRFASAGEVIDHIEQHERALTEKTKLWRDTWYDSTLPRWFLDRTLANASILATMTCVRFADGRFYGWEGIGCCDGTCGHVWQYAHSVGRLFPSLERSVREMADYTSGVGFHEDTGLIDFRGEYGFGYAADAQTGYILRTYREHQMSPDDGFLRRVYPNMRKALEYLVMQDADEDGILEGRQHNTLDVDLFGPSSWLTSLYLAALRAGEEMAKETGDAASAKRWREIYERGARRFDEVFWNGDYYIHRLIKEEHPDGMRIGNGCEIDQLMGQQWAHQLGLGRIVGESRTKAALKALYRNNFLPDVGTIRKIDPRGRWYGMPGESGLLMCTFPQGDRKDILGEKPTWASMYFNEVWTGQEYQAASHMIQEGLVEEGMRVVKAVHDRHHPSKRNPYNEVECSDHYARAMASHAAFTAACGYEYHGPKGHLGFAPKIGSEEFKAAFTAAEGWGSYEQRMTRNAMSASVTIKSGKLRLKTLSLEVPQSFKGKVRVTVAGKALTAKVTRQGKRTTLTFDASITVEEGEELTLSIPAS